MKGSSYHWRKNRSLVVLPDTTTDSLTEEFPKCYARFGRIVQPGRPIPNGAVKTDRTWVDTNEPVWAVPIPPSGWSTCQFMFGVPKLVTYTDTKRWKHFGYLIYKGEVYTTFWWGKYEGEAA